MILSTIVDGRRDQRINLMGINQFRLLYFDYRTTFTFRPRVTPIFRVALFATSTKPKVAGRLLVMTQLERPLHEECRCRCLETPRLQIGEIERPNAVFLSQPKSNHRECQKFPARHT